MGAKVRRDPRTPFLLLDIHHHGKRERIFSHLLDTKKNREILAANAEQIDRELFLGTFDVSRHFPREERHQPLSFRAVAEEWLKKKANEVTPLTLRWYRQTVGGRILPFWGSKNLEKLKPAMFDAFKAGLIQDKLASRTVNIILMRLREILRWLMSETTSRRTLDAGWCWCGTTTRTLPR
jgi:hypothetical protein